MGLSTWSSFGAHRLKSEARAWYGHAAGLVSVWTRLSAPWSLAAAWLSPSGLAPLWILPFLAAPLAAGTYAALYSGLRHLWRVPLRRLKATDTLLLAGAMIPYMLLLRLIPSGAKTSALLLPPFGLLLTAWLHNWAHEAPLTAPGQHSLPPVPQFTFPPARGPITAGYRSYDRSHTGVDLGLPTGSPVLAPAPGLVVHAGPLEQLGYAVILDHGSGWSTLYAHLDQVLAGRGSHVLAGRPLGLSGTSGVSTGPHLHLELRFQGVPVDPAPLLSVDPRSSHEHGKGLSQKSSEMT